jgi:hypothetical protein
MATASVVPAPDLNAALKALTDIKLSITGSLPGEQAFVAGINYATAARTTMDPAILKRWDSIFIQQAEDLQSLWRGMWVMAGLLK